MNVIISQRYVYVFKEDIILNCLWCASPEIDKDTVSAISNVSKGPTLYQVFLVIVIVISGMFIF